MIDPSLKRLVRLVGIALAGLFLALAFSLQGIEHTLGYALTASMLLYFGLYMAVFGIDKEEARHHLRIVAIAITLGVLCKYLLIFGVTYWLTGDIHYAILSMAVAQIDPLSVAALNNDKRLAPQTRTILNMWASFDDPMTAIATPVILVTTAHFAQQRFASGASLTDVLFSLTPFILALVLIAVVFVRRRLGLHGPSRLMQRFEKSESAQTSAVVLAGVIAIPLRLYSLAALVGWFARIKWLGKGRRAEVSLNLALYGATFLLGLLLSGGVDWRGGLVLGAATYLSQVIVAWLVMWVATKTGKQGAHRLSRRDTWHLALGQQNGITAIVLALNLAPLVPGAIGVVSLAIVTVNSLHFIANWLFDRHFDAQA